MNTKHTPGPWNVYAAMFEPPARILAGAKTVAVMPLDEKGMWDYEGQANARLIAAAPELLSIARLTRNFALAICKDIAADGQLDLATNTAALIADIDAAIAKAEGSQQ